MKIKRIWIDVFRAAVDKPVVTSFSTIPSRGVAILRLEDESGAVGWGDIWGNFPTVTTEYRARLAGFLLPDLLRDQSVDDIPALHRDLVGKLRVMAVQADEPGPVAAVLAAADQALWDLKARKAGVPLRRVLDSNAADRIPAYASGLNPADGPDTVNAERTNGHRNFKLKVGFGDEVDQGNISRIMGGLQPGERLFVDANQRWTLEDARHAAKWLAEAGVGWLEEPMIATASAEDWLALKGEARLPLAGGENLRGLETFAASHAWFDFIQPDVGKWGGVSLNLEIARAALAASKTYCPHWLGGGVGMLHSAQILAAAGGDGLLEMDVNENPLRNAVLGSALAINDGHVDLPGEPGIGPEPNLAAMEDWRVDAMEIAL